MSENKLPDLKTPANIFPTRREWGYTFSGLSTGLLWGYALSGWHYPFILIIFLIGGLAGTGLRFISQSHGH
jgi:hypothetical protein